MKQRGTLVTCKKCKQRLGHFLSTGDNGSVVMLCPTCQKECEIFNPRLMMVEDGEETSPVVAE